MKINVNPINIKKVDEDHFRAVIQIKNLINVVLEVSKYNYIDFKEKWNLQMMELPHILNMDLILKKKQWNI